MNNWLQIPGTAIWVRFVGAVTVTADGMNDATLHVIKPNSSDVHYEAYVLHHATGVLQGEPELIGTAATPVRAAALFDQVTA